MGSSSTDRYGKTTYRDAQGRIQGTSWTDKYGKTTYRDALHIMLGSVFGCKGRELEERHQDMVDRFTNLVRPTILNRRLSG